MSRNHQNQPFEVTVAVMSYNNARFIGQTIDSIFAQKGVAFELWVFDDCSTDESVEVLKRYVDDPRFHYEINERNLGLNGNYNRCLRAGQGRYVVVLGSDDILYQNHLRSLCSAMDAAPQAMLGYVQCNWIDESGDLIRCAVHPGHRDASYVGGRNEIADLLSHDNYITPSATMLRRSMLDAVALPDETLARDHLLAQDWDLWLRIAKHYPDFVFLRQATVGYRIHGGQVSQRFYADARPLWEHAEILERCLDDGVIAASMRADALQIWNFYRKRLDAYPEAARQELYRRSKVIRTRLFEPLAYPVAIGKPMFSVIVTTYNRPDLLRDTLASLEVQIFRDFEVVLVNDHGESVEHLLENCSFPLVYFNQPRNQGLSAARNAGLMLARGRYIAYLDDDDIYLPEHLQCLASVFDRDPEAVVYTDVVYVQEKIEGEHRIEVGRSFPTAHDAFDRDKLFIQNYIPVNTWAHPRSAVGEVGNFDTALTSFEDWDMLLRLVQRYPVHRIKKVTAEVRQRVSSSTDNMLARESARFLDHYRNIYARYPEAGNERVQAGRKALLAGRVSQERSWGVAEWMADRVPSAARILAIQTMLQANPDVGTLGVAVIVPEDVSTQAVGETLASLAAQHRPVAGVWLVGEGATAVEASQGVERLGGTEPWPHLLSARVEQGGGPDFLWILYAGDRLLPHATLAMGEYRLRQPNPLVWYADEATLEAGVPAGPMLKPDFNIDLLRSYPYIGRNLVLSTAAIQAVGGLDARVVDLAPVDLVWRMVEQVGPTVVGHVPEVLVYGARSLMDWVSDAQTLTWSPAVTQAHFVRMGLDAQVLPGPALGLCRVEYALPMQPLVSIIVPTRDQFSVLRDCVEGLMEHTSYPNYELLIVNNGSVEPDAVEFLKKLENMALDQVRILRWPQAFDFAAMNNFAVAQARGKFLLFLNNDIHFSSKTQPDWLERLLRLVLRPEVGMAGPRLDLPDNQVDQCGQVLGLDNSVGSAFRGEPSSNQGYMYRLAVQQNTSALSASCLMMRRDVFDELGGFDAHSFAIYYADTDLSLKATQAGYLLVLEPDTGLLHLGGATRLFTEKFGLAARPDDEQRDRLYARWLPQLARDPYYHPAFGKASPGFYLSQDAARIHEPLPGRPLPVVLAAHGDWQGCGHYRILHPFKAMAGELRLEGGLKHGDFHFTDVARIQPDVIVLQGAWLNEGILTQIRRYREITGAKVILEFDDYLPNIPTRSIYRKKVPSGLIKNMRRVIEQVDWLAVSTPTLAQEYMDFHPDIRVARNGLSSEWWGGLKGQRRASKKVRVGWAGGDSHTGDLAEIRSVVKELQDEVEWVFMGMKPDGVACEFHSGVPIAQYPAKLASLNLDLAVVPLEINQFNRCKSNLRLLELGACGVPVICTDIDPYQGDLPVTRVRNRHQDWVAAIRSHIADPVALAAKGDALRDAVLQNWMLEGVFLDQWAAAWGVAPQQA